VYTIVDDILYFNGSKGRAVVPCGLQQSMMEEYHSGVMAGHFLVQRSTRPYQVSGGGGRTCIEVLLTILVIVPNVLSSLTWKEDSYPQCNPFQ